MTRLGRFYSDHSGKTFGNWLVLRHVGGKGFRNRPHYQCRCSCGITKIVSGNSLTTGNSISCGCMKPSASRAAATKYPQELAPLRSVFIKYRWHADNKGVPFELLFEDCLALFGSSCFYCGVQPSRTLPNKFTKGTRKGLLRWSQDVKYNGIDKVVPSLGYVKGNVQPCCYTCNRAKSDFTPEEWEQWQQRLISYRRTI